MFNSRRLIGFQVSLRRYGGILKGRESSPIENPAKIPSYRQGWYDILTLDPTKFSEKKQQRLFIANITRLKANCVLHKQSTPFSRNIHALPYGHYTDHTKNIVPVPYPPGTNGFLYYATSKHRIGGELRFRVTSSNDPESFVSGSDLMGIRGRPWFRPLACLPRHYPYLYDKLKEDGLVPEDLDSVLSTLAIPKYRGDQFLYSLNDPFILDFSRHRSSFFALTEHGLESLRFLSQFTDCRGLSSHIPYTGSALVQFERSTNASHKGTRTVVLRFLKIIAPVKPVIPGYDGYIMRPEEGKLFRRYFYNPALVTLHPPVWTLDIDQSRNGSISRALRLLWDI